MEKSEFIEELWLDKEIIITSSISDPSFLKSDLWVFLVTLISLDMHIRLTGDPKLSLGVNLHIQAVFIPLSLSSLPS